MTEYEIRRMERARRRAARAKREQMLDDVLTFVTVCAPVLGLFAFYRVAGVLIRLGVL